MRPFQKHDLHRRDASNTVDMKQWEPHDMPFIAAMVITGSVRIVARKDSPATLSSCRAFSDCFGIAPLE